MFFRRFCILLFITYTRKCEFSTRKTLYLAISVLCYTDAEFRSC